MYKSLTQVFLFATCLVGLIGSSQAACPKFTTKPDFDYLQYAGVWFEIEKIPVVFEDGMTCIRAIYDKIGENKISVLNTAVLADGSPTVINGTAVQPDPVNEPGYLVVSFPGRPDGNYYVLDTDYTTYTAVYDCATIGAFTFEYAWLMGRNSSLTPEQLATARAAYTKFGINTNTFTTTVQGPDCVYIP